MKDPHADSADIGLEEQNYIIKAYRDLKDSIFNVLYVLLDKEDDQQEEKPMLGLIFESGLDYLQMLAFPFDSTIMSAWNGGETLTNVSNLFSKLNIMTYLPGVSFNTFLIMLYALILLIILVLVDIIYVSYSFSKKRFKFTWPLVILAKLVPLFVTVFFLPITQTLLSVVQCETVQDLGYQVMINFNDVVCWKGWHLFHAVITLLFVSLFVLISSVVALALFQPRMATKKLTARQNSTGQVVFIMNKIICQLIFSFNPFSDKWVYSVMLFCLSGWLYWTYNMNDPFYDKKVSKFFRIVSSYYFWTNFMLLVSQLLSPIGFNGGLIIWISGLPFIGIIIGFEHRSNIDQLFAFNLKFKSGEQLQGHLRYVLQLLRNQEEDKNSYMLVTGYIEKHKEICVEDDCPLKMAKKLNKEYTQKQDVDEKFLLQIERMYKSGIKKYPECTRLRLSFAFFQLQRLKNKNKAYEEFSYALKTDPTFEEQFIIYRFKKIIRQNLQSNGREQNKTDLIEIIRFDNHISLCEQAMVRSARLHKDFWAELKQQTPDLRKLNSIGSKITKTINIVKQNYEEIQKINGSDPQVLYCYSMYLLMVIKDNIQGRKMLQMSRKIYVEKVNGSKKTEQSEQISETQMQNVYQPVITISSKESSFGKVLNFNLLFSELSGYHRQQIVERNFQKILPDIFKDVHEQKMRLYIQSQQPSKYINTEREGYLKLKSGFVLPIQYQVYFKASSESFTVVFKNSSLYRNCCHLILDSDKMIRECSILGQVYFGLNKIKFLEKDISAEQLFGLKDIQKLAAQSQGVPFQYKIQFQGSSLISEICIKEVSMGLKQNNTQNEEEDRQGGQMIVYKNRIVGYYIRIILRSSQKIDMLHKIKQKVQEESGIQQSENGIMSLYDDPNFLDILISNLAETKTKPQYSERYQLKYKIKTMRLLNNQIKMVYDQNNQFDFQNNSHQDNQDDDLQIIKLNDDRYNQKIRSAINTKLNHEQVAKLKCMGIIFVLIIFGITITEMLISTQVFTAYSLRSESVLSITKQTNDLVYYLTATLDSTSNYTFFSNKLKTHTVDIYDSAMQITISLGNNNTETTGIRDGYLYFYSKIAQFFDLSGALEITELYTNFIQSIYPAVEEMNLAKNSQEILVNNILYICFSGGLFFSLVTLFTWMYIRLKIDKKKADILLWFLDIPISYVAYLGQNCDNYLKGFVSIKEVMSKGVKLEEEPYIQDYQELKGKQEQIQQQQKARKTLILKQRKLTFLSRLNCKHLKMSWILIFGMIYSIVIISESFALSNFQNFLKAQYIFQGKSMLWANSIHLTWYMIDNNLTTVGSVNISAFNQQNLQKFQNTMSQLQLHAFNQQILNKQSDPVYTNIVSTYSSVYFSDLCTYLDVNTTACSDLVDSSLKGGYRCYSMFIRNNDGTQKQQVRQANQQYGSVAIISMVQVWNTSMNSQVDQASNIVSILFYIYSVAGLLCFLIVWMLYLNKVNNQINQAIRMLNMIPFKLLSSSRKETRSFIIWIIREANKKKHQMV